MRWKEFESATALTVESSRRFVFEITNPFHPKHRPSADLRVPICKRQARRTQGRQDVSAGDHIHQLRVGFYDPDYPILVVRAQEDGPIHQFRVRPGPKPDYPVLLAGLDLSVT